MILNFSNPSIFTHEIADIKLAQIQSAVAWAEADGFEKCKIMVVCLDLTMENDKKRLEIWSLSVEVELP